MSELFDPTPFYELLHRRHLTVEQLAEAIGSERSHLVRVLRRYPSRGGNTRRRLAPLLTADELAALGWDADGRIVRGQRPLPWAGCADASLVLRGTISAASVPVVSRGTAEVVA